MKRTRILAFMLAALLIASFAFAESDADPTVLKIQDKTVSLSEAQAYFDELYGMYHDDYSAMGRVLSADDTQIILSEAMEMLAFDVVMDLKVAELGLSDITDEDKAALRTTTETEYNETLKAFAVANNITEEEAKVEADKQGYTIDALFEMNLSDLPYRRLYDKAAEGVTVTDEEVQAKYDEYVAIDKSLLENDAASYEYLKDGYQAMYDQYTGYDGPARTQPFFVPEGFRMVKHILLEYPAETTEALGKLEEDMTALDSELYALNEEMYALENDKEETETATEPPRTAEEIQADIDAKQADFDAKNAEYDSLREKALPLMQADIDEILAKLEAGETFDALIAAYGKDPGTATFPDGYMLHKDSIGFDTTFRDAAIALKEVGDVSEPVATDFGVHIIQYASDVEGGPVPITEEISTALRGTLLSSLQYEAFFAKLSEWLKEYEVEKHPELIVLPKPEVEPTEVPAEAIAAPEASDEATEGPDDAAVEATDDAAATEATDAATPEASAKPAA